MADIMPWEIEEVNGWIFLASEEGLLQYDGTWAEIFPFNNRRPLRSVTVDKESERIYAGGIGEFGYFSPSPLSSLTYTCLSDSIGEARHIGNIWGIYPKDGVLLMQADNIVMTYDLNSGKYSIVESPDKLDVSYMGDGILWLGTADGLKLLLGNIIVNAPNAEQLKGKKIRKILPYGKGILIVTSDGLYSYNDQQLKKETRFDLVVNKMGEIFSADINGDLLALGSVSHGFVIIDLISGDYEIYDENNSLQSNTVLSLKFDKSQNLWAGMQYGLAKVLLNQPVESIDNLDYSIGSGYVLAQKDKNLFMGTNRGLLKISYDDENKDIGRSVEIVDDMRGQVWGLTVIDGELFSSLDKGLFILDGSSKSRRIGDFWGVWDVRKMLGTPDRIYVGTYNGLHTLRKKNGTWQFDSSVEGYDRSMYNFVQESATVIWNDNGEEGIERVTIDTLENKVIDIETFTQTNDGTSLLADIYLSRIDNKVYLSTSNGIYRYEDRDGSIVKDREFSRLLGNPKVVRRLKKANGSLLALSDNELIAADPAGILGIKRMSLPPSVARPIYEGDVFFPIGNDFIGYPTKKGYLIFDFSETGDSLWQENPASVYIRGVRITNQGDSVIYRGNFLHIKEEPVLRHNENSLRIDYGTREDLERGILYSTRLNNEPWSLPSRTVSKELTELKGGKYLFEVKAISPDGSETMDSFMFRILPPWWRSKWMFTIYAVIFIFILFISIRAIQIYISRKQMRLLQEKDRELAQQKEIHQKESEDKDRHIRELEREKLDKELKHKSQEVANMMMSVAQKNDALQNVKRELQNILTLVSHGNHEARKAITELQGKVVIDIKSDEVLKRVEEEFDIVHDNFMKKLRERFPDLNNNEVMLCAYIKMNLSTKEMAPLLNISPRGVETIRYRLRKKLGLERDASLSAFISSFS